MQTLCASEYRRETLQSHADHVVLRLLCGQCDTAGLCVNPQHLASRISRTESVFHDARIQSTRGTKFGSFFKHFGVHGEEEGETGGKVVYCEP